MHRAMPTPKFWSKVYIWLYYIIFVVSQDLAEGCLCLKRIMAEHAGDLDVLSQPCWPSSAQEIRCWVGRNGSGQWLRSLRRIVWCCNMLQHSLHGSHKLAWLAAEWSECLWNILEPPRRWRQWKPWKRWKQWSPRSWWRYSRLHEMMLHTRADKICQGKDVTFLGARSLQQVWLSSPGENVVWEKCLMSLLSRFKHI